MLLERIARESGNPLDFAKWEEAKAKSNGTALKRRNSASSGSGGKKGRSATPGPSSQGLQMEDFNRPMPDDSPYSGFMDPSDFAPSDW